MSSIGPRAGGLRLIRLVLVAVAVGVMLNTAGTVYLYFTARARAVQTTNALCTVRHGHELQVERSLAFLREHPEGFAGVSAAVIRVGIADQQRQVDALAGIDCN